MRRRTRPSPDKTRLLIGAGVALFAARKLREHRYDLKGKNVLITGGSRGLGLALARGFGDAGARPIICGRDADSLQRAADSLASTGVTVFAITCDVTDQAAVRLMLDQVRRRCGPIDILVNNAGVIEVGPAETMAIADYEEAMATNFWGMLYPTLGVLPEMRARRAGRVVNITSIGGKLGIPHLLPYSASKFAAVGFSEGLRTEVSSDGIKVVTVCPGLMRTGSPRNAIFRGRHRAEYAWFSISDALPGLSISAEHAARRIVAACRRGDAEVLFPITARAAALANALAPGLTARVLSVVDRLLPGPEGGAGGRRKGSESESSLSPSWLTTLGDRAAREYNQVAPSTGATS